MYFHFRAVGGQCALAFIEHAVLESAGQRLHALELLVGGQPVEVGLLVGFLLVLELLFHYLHGAVGGESRFAAHGTECQAAFKLLGVEIGGVLLAASLLVDHGVVALVHLGDAQTGSHGDGLLALVVGHGGGHGLDGVAYVGSVDTHLSGEVLLEAGTLGHTHGEAERLAVDGGGDVGLLGGGYYGCLLGGLFALLLGEGRMEGCRSEKQAADGSELHFLERFMGLVVCQCLTLSAGLGPWLGGAQGVGLAGRAGLVCACQLHRFRAMVISPCRGW